MKIQQFAKSVQLPVAVEKAFAYHERPGALERLLPPWEDIEAGQPSNGIQSGSVVVLRMHTFGVPVKWVAEHTRFQPPFLFEDIQKSGPFACWRHQHQFAPGDPAVDNQSSQLSDVIEFGLPLGEFGMTLGGGHVHKMLDRMFHYRHSVTKNDLEVINFHTVAPQRVAISGASGLVGRQLCAFLSTAGHSTVRLVRGHTDSPDKIFAWGDARDSEGLGSVDTVIHLAGESIASSRWTDEVKQKIRVSRVDKTRELCQRLAALKTPPRTLICASATGFYGDRGDEVLDESSQPGSDFLSSVCEEWEAACRPATDAGIRVVNARFGIILSPQGGALAKMLMPARFGVGGPMGSGKQWISWIAVDDVIYALYHCLANPAVVGPVNFVAPLPLQSRDFAKVLGRVLHRPAFVPVPGWALRLGLGEMADALLLSSTRVKPTVLDTTGFQFHFPDAESALRHLLGRAASLHADGNGQD